MIPRILLWAGLATLSCISALQFAPDLSTTGGECALLLDGPGRTSSFDYNLNALRGTFGYGGQQTCITYDAINAAYVQARKRINVAAPSHHIWKTEEIATVGELLLDISISLAKTYGLSYEDIEKGLPLIDTSKTLIRDVCPPFLANVECRPGKYRRYDGLCSNLVHPTWGATMTPFTRLVGPLYADGMTAPRISVTGNQLPLPRIVSRTVHPDEGFHDHAGTVMIVAWGQFMDHDYTLTATPLDPLNRNEPEECCNRPPHLKNPYCLEIEIPADDYFYSLFKLRCQDFVRGFPAARPGCRLGSRVQFNTLTGVIDGNTVYGVSEKFSRHLRTGYGGLLRMNPVFADYGLKDLLPLKLDIPDEGCTRPNRSMYCFEGGEIRVNEQLVLTCMHTLLAREHNRLAHGLSLVNPHWDDETLYQEARRIVIGEIQHITYNEFLPILLGKEVMEKFGLLTEKEGYWDGYDPNVNPNVIDAFAAAAFRFGHSLLPTAIERWSKAHKFIASKRLSNLIRQPYDLYRAGVLDEYFMGLMNQVAQAMDDSVTQEVTNHLFKKPGARFGMDLAAFNMQRGREFGLPGYMDFRKFCGLPGAETFDELFGSMSNETIRRYASIYEHPSDVDLWSGGVSERPLPGSMLGPTFACIIATQFSYSRRGDRFWYELPNQPSSFTPEQLQEVRKAKLSRLICDNTDLIDTIQVYPMVLPDHEINPRVPCKSGILPGIDLSKWADYSGGLPSGPDAFKIIKSKEILFSPNLKKQTNLHSSQRKPRQCKNTRTKRCRDQRFNQAFQQSITSPLTYQTFNRNTLKAINNKKPLLLSYPEILKITRYTRTAQDRLSRNNNSVPVFRNGVLIRKRRNTLKSNRGSVRYMHSGNTPVIPESTTKINRIKNEENTSRKSRFDNVSMTNDEDTDNLHSENDKIEETTLINKSHEETQNNGEDIELKVIATEDVLEKETTTITTPTSNTISTLPPTANPTSTLRDDKDDVTLIASETKETLKEAGLAEGDKDIYTTLAKILQKKDTISRDEAVLKAEDNANKPVDYNTFWKLEYSFPNPS